jgi:hypothetical protein
MNKNNFTSINKIRIIKNPENIPLDIIQCVSCENILDLQNSKTCRNCLNQFCSKCVQQQTHTGVCLFCKETINFHIIPPILLKKLNSLWIRCKNEGCYEELKYDILQQHEDGECIYKKVFCKNCMKDIMKDELEKHLLECIDDNNLISCEKCLFKSKEINNDHSCVMINYIMKEIIENNKKLTEEVK